MPARLIRPDKSLFAIQHHLHTHCSDMQGSGCRSTIPISPVQIGRGRGVGPPILPNPPGESLSPPSNTTELTLVAIQAGCMELVSFHLIRCHSGGARVAHFVSSHDQSPDASLASRYMH